LRARLTALLTAGLLAATGTALTAPAAAAAPPSTDVRSSTPTTAAERGAALAYWTDERKARARPGDQRIAGRSGPKGGTVDAAAPTTVRPQAKPSKPGNGKGGGGGTATVTGATWTGGGAVAETTGKVFFTLAGSNYVCSGSSVTSGNRNLVLTAGHCLHEGPGAFASNFVFVPAYAGDGRTTSGPYGTWAAASLHTTTQWASTGDFGYDVGFAVMAPQGGTANLADTVGSQGIAFNQPRGATVHAFGYPAASPYSGATLTYCTGATVRDPYGGDPQGVVCDMTGGSSGGPWYAGFSASTGVGTSYSVNSYRYSSGPNSDKMFGPYFGAEVQRLYDAVRS
jgi:V8-like Glu-specific endopeptidase